MASSRRSGCIKRATVNIKLRTVLRSSIVCFAAIHDDHVTLVRNPDYTWGPTIFNHTGTAILDSLVYRLLPEDATRLAALKSGEVDLIDRVAPEDLASLSADTNYKTLSGATAAHLGSCNSIPKRRRPTNWLCARR